MSPSAMSPELASEVSSRLHAIIPDLRILFARSNLAELDGSDLEGLMMTAFLMGYSSALNDLDLNGVPSGAIADWASRQG